MARPKYKYSEKKAVKLVKKDWDAADEEKNRLKRLLETEKVDERWEETVRQSVANLRIAQEVYGSLRRGREPFMANEKYQRIRDLIEE